MLETPDLSKFGRSEQLHAALMGINGYLKANKKYPENNEADLKSCLEIVN
jgi:hypothetical protein